MTPKEEERRKNLQAKKPLVYDKIIRRGDNPDPILQVQYSYKCNMHCKHCSIKDIRSQQTGRGTLTPASIRILANQAHELGFTRFEINGGEPLLYKDIDNIVDAIGPARFYINLVTNAYLLDEAVATHLKDIGIDRIQVGLDSLNAEEHDDFRNKPGAHQRALAGIDYCLKVGMDIFITTVVSKQRLYSEEFNKFINYFNNKGIGVFMTFAKPVGAWTGQYDLMIDEKDLEYTRKLEKQHNVFSHLTGAYGREGGCIGAGHGLLAVSSEGHVMPCQYIFVSMGNFLEEPLKDIVDRALRLKVFKSRICPIAMDKEFVEKYIVAGTQGKHLPVSWKEVFTEKDFD